jgi:hypothetical protein
LPLLLSLLFKFTNVCATVDASFRMLYPDGTACQHGNEVVVLDVLFIVNISDR